MFRMKVYLLQNPKTGEIVRDYHSASTERFVARALRLVEDIRFAIVTVELR